ncbi:MULTISPECIES: hypothetical protein [Mycobacterium]|uniref:hypothetical protein n=1 Tax=Mycobacterium TaxID=1763 RepID=UPI00148354A9|nr:MULTISPECIES: hypothetical protein [Mycobacterium]GLB90938.1 hypothetical protein SRL2020130_37550 [Mycobacterium kiyosense]GLC13379.1 hypothetical protein SRL2020448_19820 [Mycobacterium kiyosense]
MANDLEQEAKDAILEAIKRLAPSAASGGGVQALAYAYALAVGGSRGRLPGLHIEASK